ASRSTANRFSSSAKRRTSPGSMMALDIVAAVVGDLRWGDGPARAPAGPVLWDRPGPDAREFVPGPPAGFPLTIRFRPPAGPPPRARGFRRLPRGRRPATAMTPRISPMSESSPRRRQHLLIFLTVLIDLIGFGILIPIL